MFINGKEVLLQSATANELKLIIPGGTGTGNIKVVVNDQATEGPQFKDQTLGIATLTPDNGLAGTTITITGTGFSAVAAREYRLLQWCACCSEDCFRDRASYWMHQLRLSTGDVKVMVNGQEALAPVPFKRAGVLTLAGEPDPAMSFGTFAFSAGDR